jgi:hypothetical protein
VRSDAWLGAVVAAVANARSKRAPSLASRVRFGDVSRA